MIPQMQIARERVAAVMGGVVAFPGTASSSPPKFHAPVNYSPSLTR
jgi:hypothetical protein